MQGGVRDRVSRHKLIYYKPLGILIWCKQHKLQTIKLYTKGEVRGWCVCGGGGGVIIEWNNKMLVIFIISRRNAM